MENIPNAHCKISNRSGVDESSSEWTEEASHLRTNVYACNFPIFFSIGLTFLSCGAGRTDSTCGPGTGNQHTTESTVLAFSLTFQYFVLHSCFSLQSSLLEEAQEGN